MACDCLNSMLFPQSRVTRSSQFGILEADWVRGRCESDLSLTATVACPLSGFRLGLFRRFRCALLVLVRLFWLDFRPGRKASHEDSHRPGAFTVAGKNAVDVKGLAGFDSVTTVHPHIVLGRIELVLWHWDASPFRQRTDNGCMRSLRSYMRQLSQSAGTTPTFGFQPRCLT